MPTCELCGQIPSKIFYKLDGFNIVKCGCGLIMRDRDFTTNILYDSGYFLDEQKDYFFNNRQKEYQQKLDEIERLHPRKGLMIDIGCALGDFLVEASGRGWEVMGSEISPFAIQQCQLKGIPMINPDVCSISADVITLWMSLNHFDRPGKILDRCRALLKDDGLFAVEVTRIDSLVYRLAHVLYKLGFKFGIKSGYPIHQSVFYTTDTLIKSLKKAGFDVICVSSRSFENRLVSLKNWKRVFFQIINGLGNFVNPISIRIYATK